MLKAVLEGERASHCKRRDRALFAGAVELPLPGKWSRRRRTREHFAVTASQGPRAANRNVFLGPTDGALVRLEGRLARSPSFWVKDVDIVRTYERVGGIIVPVALESKAQVRFLGEASLRMTYVYSEIEGRPLFPHP